MAEPKRYGVYQRDGQLVQGTIRATRKAARRDFVKECGSPNWRDMWLLGFCVRQVGDGVKSDDSGWEARQLAERRALKARPPKGPGFVLPHPECQQEHRQAECLRVTQLKGYGQRDHRFAPMKRWLASQLFRLATCIAPLA